MTDLLAEIVRRQVERDRDIWGDDSRRAEDVRAWAAPIVADVLDVLSADGRIRVALSPEETR